MRGAAIAAPHGPRQGRMLTFFASTRDGAKPWTSASPETVDATRRMAPVFVTRSRGKLAIPLASQAAMSTTFYKSKGWLFFGNYAPTTSPPLT